MTFNIKRYLRLNLELPLDIKDISVNPRSLFNRHNIILKVI